VSTCKAIDFWLCNPRVSGRGGTGPGRPSGMPRQCACITAGEETCSEGDAGDPDISILGTNAFDNQLAREEVIWTFFLRVGVHIGLLGVTMDSISGGEIGTRHWTSEQGAVAATARKNFPRVYSCKRCRHAETRREYWTAGLGSSMGELFKSGFLDIPPYRSIYIYYELRTNVCRWSRYHDKMVPTDNGGLIQRYTEISWRFSRDKAETLPPYRSIAINLEPGYILPSGQIYNFSELGGAIFTQLRGLWLRAHQAGSWIWT